MKLWYVILVSWREAVCDQSIVPHWRVILVWTIWFSWQIIFPLVYLLILSDKINPRFFEVYASLIKKVWISDVDHHPQVDWPASHKGRDKLKTTLLRYIRNGLLKLFRNIQNYLWNGDILILKHICEIYSYKTFSICISNLGHEAHLSKSYIKAPLYLSCFFKTNIDKPKFKKTVPLP